MRSPDMARASIAKTFRSVAVLLLVLIAAPRAAERSALADAAERGDATAIKALLKQGADVNAAQGDGMSALHWAAMNGDAQLATTLLKAGANPSSVTRING